VQLGEGALERIAASLSDLYYVLYEARPVDPRASLTGNMLAFVFEGGLSVSDEWLLRSGREEQLREFRGQFFEVVDDEITSVVRELTGLNVTYSFTGFDPLTRTTHAIFVLDLSKVRAAEERQAVLNWSEQVRRNARRLRAEHAETRARQRELKEKVRSQREAMRREVEGEDDAPPPNSSDDR
jgi:uncharacterized protein YbcI